MKFLKYSLWLFLGGSLVSSVALGANPLVTNIFTADPSGRVFNGRLYVYTSHDLPDATYWDMVDWRLLSTADLVTWKDHGSIFGVKDFAWATHWAWAPDCVQANGKYYLFLPVDRTKIGVAVGDKPEGPFKDAIGKPLIDNATLPDAGPEPIDPAVLQDDDGQTYLYFGCRQPMVVKLRPSLTELAGNLQTVSFLDAQGRPVPLAAPGKDPILPEGYGEAPFVFKRAGKYYFVYSDGWAPSATQVYAIGDHPMGPFTYAGKVMEHAASVTQHGSIVQFKGKWYVLYHTSELSNGNSFRRSVCIDELTFDANGRINTVTPTKNGPAPVSGTSGARGVAPAAADTDWNFVPAKPNEPVGIARGINPGRVVWAHDPLATKWAGNWKQKSDQWWLDANTDQARVDAMLSATLLKLTSATNDERAWQAIFEYYNQNSRGMARCRYQPGEVVALKINLNNSEDGAKADNYTDASPQMVLAMIRQFVNQAHVRPQDIIVYDVRRFIPPYFLTKVWGEFKDVRFIQASPPKASQPKNPGYGDYHGLETPDWVEGVAYSNGKYKEAKLIPKQIFDATYLVNLALLKAHSYPYNNMEDGDSGQTAITMCGKNHFGSIKGTWELHAAINPDQEGVKNAYSPIVDLAASPHLGAKTILFVLDGLYSGRKWRTYPVHFPNPPFNNRVEPYENPDWPASVLASMDGVALDSVGLDILFAQTRNNTDTNGHPRILLRANADDYLFEMAQPDHAPSGTVYKQDGKVVPSLGVHERWDSDATKQYSRNLDPAKGKGIELIYLPMGTATGAPGAPQVPAVLPGKGLAEHDFFYAGEGKTERMFIVRDGKIAWSYTHPGKGEISDAVLQPNGNILFAHQFGVTEINADKQVVWNFDAPPNTEIHTAQPYGTNSVWFVQNGDPAKFVIVNKTTGATEREFVLPVKNPKGTHGHFRHARMTDAGTLLVAHMDLGKAAEYDLNGKELWSLDVPGIWSATPLKNGNILVVSNHRFVREVNRAGETVWEWTSADAPDYKLSNLQLATRLPNGNTIINNWFNQWNGKMDPATAPVQAIEVTPDKKVVWALRSWTPPADLGPATTLQILSQP